MQVEAVTGDAEVARELVPIGEDMPKEAVEVANLSWGTLMDGQKVQLSRSIDLQEYCSELIRMLDTAIKLTNQSNELPDKARVIGYANVVDTIQKELSVLEKDEAKKAWAKEAQDALTKAANHIRGYWQRIQEQAQQQSGGQDPEVIKELMTTQSKLKIKEAAAEQTRRQRDLNWAAEQKRKAGSAQVDIALQDSRAAADILRENAKTIHQPEPKPTQATT